MADAEESGPATQPSLDGPSADQPSNVSVSFAPLPSGTGNDPVFGAGVLFSRLSNARTGLLNLEGYKTLVAQWRPDDKLLASDTTFSSFDADKDGFLSLDDFLRLVHTVAPPPPNTGATGTTPFSSGWAGGEPAARAPHMYTPGLFPYYEARAEARAWKAHAEHIEALQNRAIMEGRGGDEKGRGGGPPSPDAELKRWKKDDSAQGGGYVAPPPKTEEGESSVTVQYDAAPAKAPESISDWQAVGKAYGADGSAASAIAFGGARGVRWFDASMGVWLWRGGGAAALRNKDESEEQRFVNNPSAEVTEGPLYRWQPSTKEWLPLTRKHARALQEHVLAKRRVAFGVPGSGTTGGFGFGSGGGSSPYGAAGYGYGPPGGGGYRHYHHYQQQQQQQHPAYRYPNTYLPYRREAAVHYGAPWQQQPPPPPPPRRPAANEASEDAEATTGASAAATTNARARYTRPLLPSSSSSSFVGAREAPPHHSVPYPEPVAIDAFRGPLYTPEQLAQFQDARTAEALRLSHLQHATRRLPQETFFDDGYAMRTHVTTPLDRSRHYWTGLGEDQWQPMRWRYDRAATRRNAASGRQGGGGDRNGGGDGGGGAVYSHTSYSMEPDTGFVHKTADFEWVGRPITFERRFPTTPEERTPAEESGGGGGEGVKKQAAVGSELGGVAGGGGGDM